MLNAQMIIRVYRFKRHQTKIIWNRVKTHLFAICLLFASCLCNENHWRIVNLFYVWLHFGLVGKWFCLHILWQYVCIRVGLMAKCGRNSIDLHSPMQRSGHAFKH